MTKEFKKDDKVTCVLNGRGIVRHVFSDDLYPVRCEFGEYEEAVEDYTSDGRLIAGTKGVHLFHGHGETTVTFKEDVKRVQQWNVVKRTGVNNVLLCVRGNQETENVLVMLITPSGQVTIMHQQAKNLQVLDETTTLEAGLQALAARVTKIHE